MLDRRQKAILITVIGVLVIGALILFFVWFLSSGNKSEEGAEITVAPVSDKPPLVNSSIEIADTVADGLTGEEVLQKADSQTELSRLAASFAERFGSYSSESDFANIADLKVFMTESMKTWADKYQQELAAKYKKQAEYYGVNTRAVSVKADRFDEEGGRADFTVISQRSEVYGSKAPQTRYENLTLRMLKQGEAWKVDYAKWEE